MASPLPLAELSDKELTSLEKSIAKERKRREKESELRRQRERDAARNSALEAVAAKAREMGFDLKSLVSDEKATDGKKPRRKMSPPSVIYTHPEDASLTWTGRGRKPQWIVDLVEAGHSLESLGRPL